jgi:peptidoglycan/LPS O-acetylase OafA/YrhL
VKLLRRGEASPAAGRDLDLDVVRGLAILLAMGWHFNHPTGNRVADALLYPGRTFGWAGVDLFFVLSGFLVGRILLKEARRTGDFDRRRFMLRRAFKLWPVLYLFLLVQLISRDKPWDSYLLQNAFHVQNFAGSSLNHLWSLAVEEHFYLMAAVAFPFFARSRRSSRTLIAVLFGVMAVSLVSRLIGDATGASTRDLQWQTQYRLDGLALGAVLATVSVHHVAVWQRLMALRPLWLLTTIAGVVYLSQVSYATAFGRTFGYTVTALAGASALLLMREATLVQRWSPWLRPIGMLGVYSYSLYIWHQAAGRLVAQVAEKVFPDLPDPVLISVKYAAAIALAIGLTWLVEWPFLRLRERVVPRGEAAAGSSELASTDPAPTDERQDEQAEPQQGDPAR